MAVMNFRAPSSMLISALLLLCKRVSPAHSTLDFDVVSPRNPRDEMSYYHLLLRLKKEVISKKHFRLQLYRSRFAKRRSLYYYNSSATFNPDFWLLLSGVCPQPGPSTDSINGSSIKCLTLNARSFKSYHIDNTTNTSVSNLQRFRT